jgi:DNA-binding NtrC family response regulator
LVTTRQCRVDRETESQRPERIECVFLTCFRSDYSFLATVLQYSAIRMHRAETLDEADFLLTVTGATAFLSDVTFPDGTWRDALAMVAEVHPLTPALVVAEPVDSQFLPDVYRRGACGVLWKPIDFIQALGMIRTADQAARDRAFFRGEAGRLPAAVSGRAGK